MTTSESHTVDTDKPKLLLLCMWKSAGFRVGFLGLWLKQQFTKLKQIQIPAEQLATRGASSTAAL